MRRVKYDNYHIGKVKGLFHAFGVDYEEFETGVGMWTTAIIEKDNGEVVTVCADEITFITDPFAILVEESKEEKTVVSRWRKSPVPELCMLAMAYGFASIVFFLWGKYYM